MIPRRLRMEIRRRSAVRTLRRSSAVWPLDPSAGKPPSWWRGWPENKQFAFVLTHDVEGLRGYHKIPALMELEARSGFQSSFNLVPEGEYKVEEGMRAKLLKEGFEVGIHDLHHDGKLYNSQRGFREKAGRINRYLKEWNAVGFRSAFMLHNLQWLGELDVLYDASTFDTDPFEPQPDGAGTIFPFWVPRPKPVSAAPEATRNGYVELPYTLVQDSTLFLVLGEKTTALWEQKLDWIARHGGMALINVHPDYLDFSSSGDGSYTYAASLYERFLAFVKAKYEGQYWLALPKQVAEHAAGCCAAPGLTSVASER